MKTIDVHSHFITESYLNGLKAQQVDPFLVEGFPTPKWSEEDHLKYMEDAEIDHCILSLSSPHFHFGDDKLAANISRVVNEEAASICNRYPEKFSFAACLPMPDIESSLEEIRYAYDTLGAVGIKVASNNHGVYLGDPYFDPVFDELNRRKAVVTIHPTKPLEVPENVFTEKTAPLFEYLSDTTRAVLNMITNGTLEKYPDIKVIVPHSGSFLPMIIHRLIGISEVLIPQGVMEKIDVNKSFSKLYFDIAGDALPVALPALLQVTDPSHIMYGGDFPYTPASIVVRKKKLLLENEQIKPFACDIFYQNAERVYQNRLIRRHENH